MKKYLFAPLAFLLAAVSCTRETNCHNSFKVKVLLVSCNEMILQIQDTARFGIGEDGWVKDPSDVATTYDHVFRVKNMCEVQKQVADKQDITTIIPIGAEFNISIKEKYTDCAVCNLGYLHPLPAKKYAISICK